MATERVPYRFSVGDYHRMAEAGILHEDSRVELVNGEILAMSLIGARHAHCVARLTRLLVRQMGEGADLHVQNPLRLGEHDEPQPDVTVVRARDYGGELPGPRDVLLVIEVSEYSLRYDRMQKLPLYAWAGIPEAWLVDLAGEAMERHTEPVNGSCSTVVHAGRGAEIESTTLPDLVLPANDVLR